jgi:hypothetical protein
MAHRILQTDADRAGFIRLLDTLKLPLTVEWVQGRDRTRDQNSLQWLWASEVAAQRGDVTADEVQREWKLRHGVPILREDSASFRATYDEMVRPRSYEEKVALMAFIDVTSDMKVRQMVRYLDAVQRECLEQGFRLTDPDPELAAYQARYRTARTHEAA